MQTLFLLVYDYLMQKDQFLITAPNFETAKEYLAEELGTDQFEILYSCKVCSTENYVNLFMSNF